MGSSTASENTINTSTDSANTMVTLVTTTDGEQNDDSLDLIDVPAELSPPPVIETAAVGTTAHGNHHHHHHQQQQHPPQPGGTGSALSSPPPSLVPIVTTAAASQQQTVLRHGENGLPATALAQTTNGAPGGCASSARSLAHNGLCLASAAPSPACPPPGESADSPGAPPPTPMVGPHQESRFTFSGSDQRGRIPALPDLRAADFFSQPVRGSVDAGQPDAAQQIGSMLALAASANSRSRRRSSTTGSGAEAAAQQTGDRSPADAAGKAPQPPSTSASSVALATRPNINVTTNPLDMSLCGPQAASAAGRAHGRGAGGGGGPAGGKRTAQATIVVQQPSLSLDAPAATILLRPTDAEARRREENMRQLLDVANTLTMQEIHDFEMRYGSPHHSRSHSMKTPGSRASGRPNQLCPPQQRSRVASMPNTGVEEEYYRLRHFSITINGVVNRGDSLKSRRSRSNNSVASSNSSNEHLTASYPGSARNSAAGSLASSRGSSASQGPAPYRVLMLGATAVGKSSLVSQFMTSEYLHAYDTSIDDESGEKTVSVLLESEESELTFIDHPCSEITPENCIATYEPHGYCVVYSTTDRASMRVAEEALQSLWQKDHIATRAVILVGNKVDLKRSCLVSTQEGKMIAIRYDCKFIETSVIINHNVDELLVGLLTQIRLKLENPERGRDSVRRYVKHAAARTRSPLGSCSENNSPKKYRNSRTSASLKVRNLLGKVWARDSKSKSCENLHVL